MQRQKKKYRWVETAGKEEGRNGAHPGGAHGREWGKKEGGKVGIVP